MTHAWTDDLVPPSLAEPRRVHYLRDSMRELKVPRSEDMARVVEAELRASGAYVVTIKWPFRARKPVERLL